LVDKLDLYIYEIVETPYTYDYVRTKHTPEEIREMIITAYSHNGVPKIEIVDGNYKSDGSMYLVHRYAGLSLDVKNAIETMKHIYYLWGRPIYLQTIKDNKNIVFLVNEDKNFIQKNN